MCCEGSRELTLKFLRKNKKKKTITVYKVLKRKNEERHYDYWSFPSTEIITPAKLVAPYRGTEYCAGEISMYDAKYARRIKKDTSIYSGIHVFLTRKPALKLARTIKNGRLVKMTARISDLLAVGNFDEYLDNAVFKKVFLSKEAYAQAMRKRS